MSTYYSVLPRRRTGAWLAVLAAAALIVAVARDAGSQVLYGSIVGNVTGAQGATAPGVALTATNTGTGLKVETVSDSDGAFTFRNLLPGTYDLAAALSGFREYRQTGIAISAGNPVRVNVKMEVGALNETVQVSADATRLQTDKADLSTELTS